MPISKNLKTVPIYEDGIEDIKNLLQDFILNNKESNIAKRRTDNGNLIVIEKPWADESLEIRIPQTEINLCIDLLNNLILPPTYSAIWHTDSQKLEIIYTAFPVEENLLNRNFTFRYVNKDYNCYFGEASKNLMYLAEHFVPISGTSQNYRNLWSFNAYISSKKENSSVSETLGIPLSEKPVCFWIEGIDWNDDTLLDLVNHLNFYMSYFDITSPQIIVHTPPLKDPNLQEPLDITDCAFPKHVNAKSIDDTLLNFWSASREGDEARKFLYSFKIIEYASHFFLEKDIKNTVRKILSNPNSLDELDNTTQNIISALAEAKLQDSQKIDAIVKNTLNLSKIWNEIQKNVAYFAQPITFDGGFKVDALIKHSWDLGDFSVNGHASFSTTIRNIRNALSHGRDQKTTSVITATKHNYERLKPWTDLIRIAAGEVIIYKDV